MKILLLGSADISTSLAYKKFNLPESVLVTSPDQEYSIGHTSRQEFSSDSELEKTLASAEGVYWTFPADSEYSNKSEYYIFLEWLKQYQLVYKNIINFSDISLDPYLWKSNLPKLTENDAVFLGCSFTAGIALPGDISNRYANLVAKNFNKNCVNLSTGGGNNNRSIDIFGQLDFVDNQIVVLQLTYPERLRYIDEDTKKYKT